VAEEVKWFNAAKGLAPPVLRHSLFSVTKPGAPLPKDWLEILIFANSCSGETASVVRRAASSIPHPVVVVEGNMPEGKLNDGWLENSQWIWRQSGSPRSLNSPHSR
jgi:hypothetical protein